MSKKEKPLVDRANNTSLKIKETEKSESKRYGEKPTKDFYTVQVGAFKEQKKAQELLHKLKNKKYPAYLIKVDLGKKGIWYRVRVGQFLSKQEANKQAYLLAKEIGIKGFVTKSNK